MRNSGGATVRTLTISAPAGAGAITWNGLDTAGTLVPDGSYVLDVAARDATGNMSPVAQVPLVVATARSGVAASPAWISPAGSSLDPRVSTLSFTLARPARVTWQVTTTTGVPVRTWDADTPLDAGAYSVRWDGRNDAGVRVPAGCYLSQVTVADGITTSTEQVSVFSGGIRIATSDTTPAAGQVVTITVVAAEALRANPTVWVAQPGRNRVTYRTTKTGTSTYRVQVRLRSGSSGRLTVGVSGIDRSAAPQPQAWPTGCTDLLRARLPEGSRPATASGVPLGVASPRLH